MTSARSRRAQLDADLAVARIFQQSLIPKECRRCGPGGMAAKYLPAQFIGGDFYNFVELDERRFGLFIGDAFGHGIAAAMIMAMATTLVKNFAVNWRSPAEVLRKVNKSFCETVGRSDDVGVSLFFSLFYAVVEPGSKTLRYANAGHPPPLLVRAKGRQVEELSAHGTVLGISCEEGYGESRVRLQPGERIVLYTDGLIEAFGPKGDIFGLGRLKRIVQAHGGQNAERLLRTIEKELMAFTGKKALRDDVTLLVIGS